MEEILKNLEEKDRKMAEALLAKMEQLKTDTRAGLMTEKDAEERFATLQKNMEQFDQLVKSVNYQTQIDAISKEIGTMKAGAGQRVETVIDNLKKHLTPEKLSELKSNVKARHDFELKTVGNMSNTDSLTGQIPQALRLAGVSKKPDSQPLIMDLIAAIPVQSNTIEYVEETLVDGNPAFLIEQATFPQMEITYRTRDAKVKKVGAFIKITREMLSDVSFVLGEITNRLLYKIGFIADGKMLIGSESVRPEDWDGIVTVATAFDNEGFQLKTPNIFDVLSTAITQLVNKLRVPDTIWMNPSDVNAMKLTKNDDGSYIMPLLIMANGNTFAGLRVVANPLITKRKFLLADTSVINFYVKEGIEIEMAYENDTDFIKDLVTIKGRMRAAFFVKNHDKDAIVYGDFDTAIAAMTEAS
jgi:HK97 family phage major capsid protein